MDILNASTRVIERKHCEYELIRHVSYTAQNFHVKLRAFVSHMQLQDNTAMYALHEICLLVLEPEFIETKLKNKMGFVLSYHGFPLLTMECVNSHIYKHIVVVDIDNFIFNKKIESEVHLLNDEIQSNIYTHIGAILIIGCATIAVLYSIFK
jgi:hypothetical protein